jgi:hypothetical protein
LPAAGKVCSLDIIDKGALPFLGVDDQVLTVAVGPAVALAAAKLVFEGPALEVKVVEEGIASGTLGLPYIAQALPALGGGTAHALIAAKCLCTFSSLVVHHEIGGERRCNEWTRGNHQDGKNQEQAGYHDSPR